MPRRSAGVLLHRGHGPDLEVLLVHPGGPLWARKDAGAWTIPKRELDDDEDPLAAARRELAEDTGVSLDGLPDARAFRAMSWHAACTLHGAPSP